MSKNKEKRKKARHWTNKFLVVPLAKAECYKVRTSAPNRCHCRSANTIEPHITSEWMNEVTHKINKWHSWLPQVSPDDTSNLECPHKEVKVGNWQINPNPSEAHYKCVTRNAIYITHLKINAFESKTNKCTSLAIISQKCYIIYIHGLLTDDDGSRLVLMYCLTVSHL